MATRDPRDKRINGGQNNAVYILQNESYLENNLYRLAASRTDTAVAILKTALEKPLSNNTFEQLNRLSEKDQSAATEAASSVIKRVIAANYIRDGQPDYTVISLSNQIVEHYIGASSSTPIDDAQVKLRFDRNDVQALVTKLIASYLSQKTPRLSQQQFDDPIC